MPRFHSGCLPSVLGLPICHFDSPAIFFFQGFPKPAALRLASTCNLTSSHEARVAMMTARR